MLQTELYNPVITSSTLWPHTGCRMGHRKVIQGVYDYQVPPLAVATYKESEQEPEGSSKPVGQKHIQCLGGL